MLTGHDRLARIWGPAVASMVTPQDIDNRKRLARALTDDGIVRLDALPDYVVPMTYHWEDTGNVGVQLLMPSHYVPVPAQLREIVACIYTAPTGQAITVDIETMDNDLLGTVSIVAGANYGATTGLAVDVESGIWLRADVTQIGSGTVGNSMTVVAMLYPRTV